MFFFFKWDYILSANLFWFRVCCLFSWLRRKGVGRHVNWHTREIFNKGNRGSHWNATLVSFHPAERRGKLFNKSRSIYSLSSSRGRELKITYSAHKIIGVILFSVNIPATASVNSETNFLKFIFKECLFFNIMLHDYSKVSPTYWAPYSQYACPKAA